MKSSTIKTKVAGIRAKDYRPMTIKTLSKYHKLAIIINRISLLFWGCRHA